jgi:alpha-N-arabinofuranosidase
MEGLITKHSAIMGDDLQKKIALIVDEWGSWYARCRVAIQVFSCNRTACATLSPRLEPEHLAWHADRARGANIA